jgi:predicted nucleic acid-binding protein
VIGELREGFSRSTRKTENKNRILNFLSMATVVVAEVSEKTAVFYADFKSYFRAKGTPIPENDVWIAACAFEIHAPLPTRDRHFEYLPQVTVQFEAQNLGLKFSHKARPTLHPQRYPANRSKRQRRLSGDVRVKASFLRRTSSSNKYIHTNDNLPRP